VILDEEHGILHVANYGGGSYVAYSVDKTNGEILEEIFFEDYGKGSNVDPDRQADAHAHMAFFIKEFIYVVDLGSDKIHHYKVKCITKNNTIKK
jgi:6-phosphogluconolactonase